MTTFSAKPSEHGALTIRKRPTRLDDFTPCYGRCKDDSSSGCGLRPAGYVATILGHDTPLCRRCAREWPKMWGGALDQPQGEAAVESEVAA